MMAVVVVKIARILSQNVKLGIERADLIDSFQSFDASERMLADSCDAVQIDYSRLDLMGPVPEIVFALADDQMRMVAVSIVYYY